MEKNIVEIVLKELCEAVESQLSDSVLSKRCYSKRKSGKKFKSNEKRKRSSADNPPELIPVRNNNEKSSDILNTIDGKEQQKKKHLKKRGLRRNIRSLLGDKQLKLKTQTLREKEQERLIRLGIQKSSQVLNTETFSNILSTQNKSLKSNLEPICLDSDSDDQVVHAPALKSSETICILSSDSEEEEEDYTSDFDSQSDRKVQSGIYYSELGLHTNDLFNVCGVHGHVLVNVNHPSADPDIFLPKHLEKVLKPHQIGGVRFLYDNLIETTADFKLTHGNGCILAHAMGLGKTIQTIAFVDIFLRCTKAKKVLCVVPVNTVQNWMHEFNLWMPPKPEKNCENPDVIVKDLLNDMIDWVSSDNCNRSFNSVPKFPAYEDKSESCNGMFREFKVYLIDSQKNLRARASLIGEWENTGGVLLIGYEMYRAIALHSSEPKLNKLKKGKSTSESAVFADLKRALCKPGPDLVICDEGHRIRNYQSGVSQALKSIRTRKRLVLTGYPLQNNLIEYWCMVDFVRPNYLGSRHEFSNMFERPIMNGQCIDSNEKDKHLMRQRAHVLYSLLQGFVQRRGHNVLKTALPPKEEHVLIIRLSPIQKALYKKLIDSTLCNDSMNPIKTFSLCCKIWNHPDILYKAICATQQGKQLEILCDEDDIAVDDSIKAKRVKKFAPGLVHDLSSKANEEIKNCSETQDLLQNISSWAGPLFKSYLYVPGKLENSGKFLVLHKIIQECMAHGDKMLIFSQSLLTLSSIEEFLQNIPIEKSTNEDDKRCCWKKDRDYFRIDGSTSAVEREKLIRLFNSKNNIRTNIFLLSTRAGCLGINLVGANRVVVFDVSWNPCHDAQAVCRVYRYGQEKPCHIYRFVASNTMEKKIYYRQISKQGISDRVIDEQSLTENFSKREIQSLLEEEWCDEPVRDYTAEISRFNDQILRNVLQDYPDWITEVPFKHESLLINEDSGRLTAFEKREAKLAYEKERFQSSQPPCRSFPLQPSFPRDTPIVPVRPFLWRPPLCYSTSNTNSISIPTIYNDVLSSSNLVQSRINQLTSTRFPISSIYGLSRSSSTNQSSLYGCESSYPYSSFGINSFAEHSSTFSTQRETLASYPATFQSNASDKDLCSTPRETSASYPTTVQKNASAQDLYSIQRETFNERDSLMYDSSASSASQLLMFLKNRENESLNCTQFDQDVSNAAERNKNLLSAAPYSIISDYSSTLRSNDSEVSENLKNELSNIADFIKCPDANLYSNSQFTKTSGDLLFPKKGHCYSKSRTDLPLQNVNRSTAIDNQTNSSENDNFDGERTDEHLLLFQTKVPCDDVIVLDD